MRAFVTMQASSATGASEEAELGELATLLNVGMRSNRSERRQQQECAMELAPGPSRSEVAVMPVAQAVQALIDFVGDAKVVEACCERWTMAVTARFIISIIDPDRSRGASVSWRTGQNGG